MKIPTGFSRAILAGAIVLVWSLSLAFAGRTVYVGKKVAASQRQPMQEVQHESWDGLLKKYVDEAGMVDYKSWQASPADSRALDSYLEILSTAQIEGAEPKVALAFWINAYNAVTVKGILREYPTSSIRNHTARVVGYNIWHDLKLSVDGQDFSLDQIEHQVLRTMGEPRIHFAIVCASIGCPRLLSEAYVPEELDEQLERNTREFFAQPTKFGVDIQSRKVQLSPILKWFGEDFGDSETERLEFIAQYAPEAAQPLLQSGKANVSYLDYDWDLNSQ